MRHKPQGKRGQKKHDYLKRLREICALTQQQFADELRVSKQSVVSIEIGRMKMSDEMLKRIVYTFGVDRASLRDPAGAPMYREPATGELVPYTTEHWASYREPWIFHENPDNIRATEIRYDAVLTRLLTCARKAGPWNGVSSEFQEWVTEMLISFPDAGVEFFRFDEDFHNDKFWPAVFMIAGRLHGRDGASVRLLSSALSFLEQLHGHLRTKNEGLARAVKHLIDSISNKTV